MWSGIGLSSTSLTNRPYNLTLYSSSLWCILMRVMELMRLLYNFFFEALIFGERLLLKAVKTKHFVDLGAETN